MVTWRVPASMASSLECKRRCDRRLRAKALQCLRIVHARLRHVAEELLASGEAEQRAVRGVELVALFELRARLGVFPFGHERARFMEQRFGGGEIGWRRRRAAWRQRTLTS